MKKLLAIVVAVVAVGVIASLSITHYKNYQNKQKAQAVPVVTLSDANKLVDKRVAEQKATDAVEFNQAVAECQKGSNAFSKLTPTLKLQTPSPVCPSPKE